jgi:MFS transporter, OFA family, oxalate/formate antiporter
VLHTAKGLAGLLVPLGSFLVAGSGNWHVVFMIAAVMDASATVLALVVLRPTRFRPISRSRRMT